MYTDKKIILENEDMHKRDKESVVSVHIKQRLWISPNCKMWRFWSSKIQQLKGNIYCKSSTFNVTLQRGGTFKCENGLAEFMN